MKGVWGWGQAVNTSTCRVGRFWHDLGAVTDHLPQLYHWPLVEAKQCAVGQVAQHFVPPEPPVSSTLGGTFLRNPTAPSHCRNVFAPQSNPSPSTGAFGGFLRKTSAPISALTVSVDLRICVYAVLGAFLGTAVYLPLPASPSLPPTNPRNLSPLYTWNKIGILESRSAVPYHFWFNIFQG